MRVRAVMVCLVLLAPLAVAGFAQDDAPAQILAAELVELPAYRSEIFGQFQAVFPDGTATRLAVALIDRDMDFWEELQAKLAATLEEGLEEKRVRKLAKLFSKDPEKGWEKSSAEILEAGSGVLDDPASGLPRKTAATGCVVGMLAPNLDAALKRSGRGGEELEIDDALLAQIGSILGPARQACQCFVDRGVAELGTDFFIAAQDPVMQKEMAERFMTPEGCLAPLQGLMDDKGTAPSSEGS